MRLMLDQFDRWLSGVTDPMPLPVNVSLLRRPRFFPEVEKLGWWAEAFQEQISPDLGEFAPPVEIELAVVRSLRLVRRRMREHEVDDAAVISVMAVHDR